VAVELLHCASLVHDDLPCFDDSPTRRGVASLHLVYGEPLAVLTGDGLIVGAFEALALAGSAKPTRLAALVATVARAAGSPHGLVAGQAFESESNVSLNAYHQAKTGSLFSAASMAGAIAAGHDPEVWRVVGEHLGGAYQVADDLLDAVGSSVKDGGKPRQRDAALARPNAVLELGVDGALKRLHALVASAMASVPPSHRADAVRALIAMMSKRLVPASLKQSST
jgi:geranylgeranyl diphosphate synthase type II